MSDLIDFETPNAKNIELLLPSPLIPVPEYIKDDGSNINEAGSHIDEFDKHRSPENNPFDMVMEKIIDYEKNKEDPFEIVIEKAKKCNSMSRLEEPDDDMSIITDLNNTNLISDSTNENHIPTSCSCDNNIIPNICISSVSHDKNLSLLNNSSMNDSLLDNDCNIKRKTNNPATDFTNIVRSLSLYDCLGNKNKSSEVQNRRSMSASDTLKSNIFEDYLLNSAHSSIFDDPLNKAFRKNSSRSNPSYNSSCLSNQFDLSINKQNLERQISNSSEFSGLSNISAIPTDPLINIRQNRFYSESSTFSGISNLSTISSNNIISSSDSSVFSNDTLNKGFINNKIQSANLTIDKSSLNSDDKSDLIKKFFEIKTKVSSIGIQKTKTNNKKEDSEVKNSVPKCNMLKIDNKHFDEKLIDIDSNTNSNENEMNNIILHEARLLAETFEKMALSKEPMATHEDDLLSTTKLNFDYLPKSDDETVDNLIDLPSSPLKNTLVPNVNLSTETNVETNAIVSNDNLKELEKEFIAEKSSNNKIITATLMLDLEKLIKEENNPDANKALNDLQKLLGIQCDNNTEILQLHLQNSNELSQNKSIDDINFRKSANNCKYDLNKSKKNIENAGKIDSFGTKEILDNKPNNTNINNLKLNVVNELKEKTTDDKNKINEIQRTNNSKKHVDKLSEDESLAGILISTLNKILDEKNKNSAIDILRKLGTSLNAATEFGTKNNLDIKNSKKSKTIKSRRSSNSLCRSPNPKNTSAKNQSFDVSSHQRRVSVNPTYSSTKVLDASFSKDKRRSQLLNIKKRFSSDPGFKDFATERKENEVPMEQQFDLKTSGTTTEQIRTKFKKKFKPETITTKGPLKAIIPLGNMQKQGLNNQKMHNLTPPKSLDFVVTPNMASSTPNTSGVNKNSKSEPKASSTPNIEGVKSQRTNIKRQQDSKKTSIFNESSMSFNSSIKEQVHITTNANKRMQQTLPLPTRPFTPNKSFERSLESKLPRYSPRCIRVRNNSLDNLKAAKSIQTIHIAPKNCLEKKLNQPTVLTPLKNFNKLSHKENHMTKLVSSNHSTGPEKENYI